MATSTYLAPVSTALWTPIACHTFQRQEQGQLQGHGSGRREDHRTSGHNRRHFRGSAQRSFAARKWLSAHAAAFTSSGDRDAANDIRYLGREREREATCEKASWREGWGVCVLQTALGSVAGYGIGFHTFVVLPWVLVFCLAGAMLLWWTVPAAKQNGAIWCFFASLAQLLPVTPINKELTEFFNDPERKRLKGWQIFVFSALGVIGLALGAILIVAVSGLTQSS
jgi:hypothetical protein